jgi:hypothetical protein
MLSLLQVEWIKLRRDKAYIWALIGFLGSPLMVTAMFVLGKSDLLKRNLFTLDFFCGQNNTMQALLLGPIMVAVLATQMVTNEYRSKTLKAILPLPTSLPALFATKVLVGAVSLFAAIEVANGISTLIPLAIGVPQPADTSYWQVLLHQLTGGLTLSFSFLASLVFAMVVSLVSKNFVVPLAASAVTIVGGLLSLQAGKGLYTWTALPLYAVSAAGKDASSADTFLPATLFTLAFVLTGLLWAQFTTRPE